MKFIRILAAVLGFGSFLFGCFLSFASTNLSERSSGQTLAQAGATIIAGLLISLAILEKHGRK
jgi:hypothetical protein